MKANKITLKKFRLNYLETMVTNLTDSIDWRRSNLEDSKKDLESAISEPFDNDDDSAVRSHERNVRYYREIVENYESEIAEGEKLLAELEKMV